MQYLCSFSKQNTIHYVRWSHSLSYNFHRDTFQNLIVDVLYPMADKDESKVFYLKMKGDYYRYLSEVAKDPDRTGWSYLIF